MIREVAKAKSCRTLQAWGQSGGELQCWEIGVEKGH